MSNLAVRVLVAAIGIPIIVILTMTGGPWFAGFVAIVASVGLHEYYRLGIAKGASPQVATGIVFGLCVVLAFFLCGTTTSGGRMTALAAVAGLMIVFLPIILLVELFRDKAGAMANVAVTVMGVGYVSIFLGTLIGVREMFLPGQFPSARYFFPGGPMASSDINLTVYRWGGYTVLTVFTAIWICDSAAYFAGRAWGKHKLFPRVSPNKSWEGAIAGFLGAIVAFLIARAIVLPYMSVSIALVCGMIVGVFGQLGDLVESLLKRDAGVKDSSSLIPGHGGVLDRFDSIMFVSPMIFIVLSSTVF